MVKSTLVILSDQLTGSAFLCALTHVEHGKERSHSILPNVIITPRFCMWGYRERKLCIADSRSDAVDDFSNCAFEGGTDCDA